MNLEVIIIIFIFLLFIFILSFIEPIFMKYNVKNDNEYGSARFATIKEIKENFYEENINNINETGFPVFFSKNLKKVYFDRDTPHYVYLGSTGSGKSVTAVIPTCTFIANAKIKRSVFVTDPKGEIYHTTSKMFEQNGYNILTIDFRHPEKSNKLNILEPIIVEYEKYLDNISKSNKKKISAEDKLNYNNIAMSSLAETNRLIKSLANMIMQDKVEQNDPFWNNSAQSLLEGIIGFYLEEYRDNKIKREQITMTSIRKFQNSSMESVNFLRFKKYISKKEYGQKSKDSLTSILSTSDNTYKSITGVFGEKMSLFDDINVANVISSSDFDFNILGKEPTALYIIVPDEDKTYYKLVTIIVGLLYKELVKLANSKGEKKLPIEIDFILDEFANCPPLADIETIVSVARSRGMHFHFFIQSFSQLDNVYGKEVAQIILDNSGTYYLKTNTMSTAEAISKMLGKKTIESNSVRQSISLLNYNGDRSTNLIGRDLMTPEEVKQLHYKTIIFPTIGYPIYRKTILYKKFSCYKPGEVKRQNKPLIDLSYTYYTVEKIKIVQEKEANKEAIKEFEYELLQQDKEQLSCVEEILNKIFKNEYHVKYNKAYLKAGVERINGQDRINRTLIKFNLPEIGTGSEIIGAYLDLVGYPTTTSYPSDRTATMHRITQDWDESTANWITMNDKYDSKVESLYYGHRSTIDGSTIIPAYNYYSGDITSIVKKWYRDTPNYGLMIKSTKETYVDDDFPTFYSKDNNLTSNNPKPVFQLVYRNHNGLESYLDYKELSYTDGSMYVNTYNGNLVSIFNIGQIVGSKLPCELDLIYNTNDVVLQNNTIYGNGCKLNFNQTLKEVMVSDTSYLEYNDENGTIHYFYEDENVSGKYIDEDGLSLTIQKDANNCVMTDKNNNIMTFTKYNNIYYLNIIEDTNQNILTIEFDNTDYNKISRIYDSNNNQISLTYSNEQIEITSSDASIYLNYSNNNLSSILTPNGTTSFSYNANGLISSVIDITGMKNNYEYYNNLPYRLKKITQYGLNNEEGQSFELNYGFDTTSIIDHKDRVTNLIYNSSGNLVSSNSLNSSEDLNGAYSIVQEYDYQQQNKIINVNSPVKYIKNYLKNTSFETDTEYFTIDSTNILKAYDSNNCVSGTRSLKLETLSINQSIEQIISVPKGAYYTFSGYFISDYPIKISLSYTNINNDEILNETIIPSSSDFIREDVSIYYDESATNNLKIKISIPNISTVYIDDIQLEEGEVANHYNIIENSDFSEGYNDWTSTSWVYDSSDTPPTDFLEIANFNNNQNKALKIKMNPLYGTRVSKTLPIKGKEGDLYTISFWYKNEGYAADGGTVGNSVSIYFKPVGQDAEYCIMTSEPFNPNDGIWQYFTYRDRAREDFESITINFLQGREANNLYITNVSFYKDVTSGDYGYDSNGNVVSIENQSKEKSVFKYDNNNQLLNASSPIGKNFKYEYDNDKRRLLNAISSSGVANQIKYDSNGNPISIRISKRKTNIIDGNSFRIRSKGTEKYIKARFRNLVVETDPCSNTIWTFTQINDGYKISHSLYPNYSISLVDNTIMLSPQNSNNLFELEENDNGSYYLKTLVPSQNGNLIRYLKVNDNLLELATLVDDDPTFEFYIEETDSKFIENSATYSSDGRFVTSITDSSFNTTIYDTNSNTGLVNYKINPKGVQTDYTYNGKNQITSITTNDKEVNYEYSNNRINKITLGNKEYNILYDNFLNISKIKIGNNITLLENTYGLFNDNLQSVRYGNNQTISYQYDEFDRISRITKSDDVYNYKYDNSGKIAKVISNNNLVKVNYDKSGRLYRYKDNNLRIGYTYDSDNNVTNVIYKTNNQENEVSNIYNADGILTQSLFENQTINYTYDGLNRIINKNINNNYSIQYDYVSYGNRTTILPKSINNNNDIFEYKYDKMDNIVEIYHNNTIQKKYNYNVYNELLEEENYDLNTKVTYTYDLFGNILSKQTINLTTSELISTDSYQYSQGDWKDLLLGYNNLNITYDAIGNPVSIGNNIQMLWINGHELNSYSDNSNNLMVNYEYNDKGIRTSKTVNNVKTSYYLEGNDIVYEKTGDNTIYYIRDNDGLIGLKYNNNIYYYIKNVQGDILGILDNNLNQLVSYQYDSWGKIINFTDTSADGIGEINPFRYRSYYYDKETNLYYLNYRYYNPDWCRFISADSFIGATGDHNGYNLYTYVSNNPINNADFSGQSLKSVIKSIKKTVKKVSKAVKSVKKKVVSTVKKVTKTVINTVVSVVKTVVNSKKTFVVEGQVGFGIGGKVGQGTIKTEAEASKGFGWGYRSDTGSYEFTSNSIGASTEVFGNKDLEFGLGAELRNYDKYTNPMIMPWEVWDSENTSKEVTFGFSKKNYTGEGSRDFSSKNDTVFIGIDLSGYLAIGGGVKIGFELDP